MRVHVPAFPHTETTREYDWCAYTAKVRKFGQILSSYGHEVIIYSGEENSAVCTEHVTVVTDSDRTRWFGEPKWPISKVFNYWDADHISWQEMNQSVTTAILERSQPGDFLGIIAGDCQQSLVKTFKPLGLIPIEWGVGYHGILNDTFCAFESYSHMHQVYGRRWFETGRFFDRVIPNSFDPDELSFSEEKDDYFLYLGRQVPNKGMQIVNEISKRYPVVIAGQIDASFPPIQDVDYRGVVLGAEKAKLISRARAVLVPTIYIEPFGGIAIEAMMSGTPVITTDWGAFTETVTNHLNGYRCRMLSEFLEACEMVRYLTPSDIRDFAINNYSLSAVAPEYDAWLTDLSTLDNKGWYTE